METYRGVRSLYIQVVRREVISLLYELGVWGGEEFL